MTIVVGVAAMAMSLTACNPYGYDGAIDSITPATVSFKYGPSVLVEGWVHSTKDNPWWVFATIDGRVAQPWYPDQQSSSTIAVPRPDVQAAVGGSVGGFRFSVTPPGRGSHRLCVHAVPATDVARRSPAVGSVHGESDAIGCRPFDQPRDWTDRGAIDQVTVVGNKVEVRGWLRYTPPFLPANRTGGVLGDGAKQTLVLPPQREIARPDVDAIFGEGTKGFIETYAYNPAVSRWCVSEYDDQGDHVSSVTPFACANQP